MFDASPLLDSWFIHFISLRAYKDISGFWFGFVWVQLPDLGSFQCFFSLD